MTPGESPDAPEPTADAPSIPDAVVVKRRGISVVWIVPILAATVGAWLWYQAVQERGPEVVISFETAEGLEAGKTKLKFKNVEVGQVETIELKQDLSGVEVRARLGPKAGPYLVESTRFWVVRPRIGAGGVSGLGTLVSGAYIEVEPGTSGAPALTFVGLEQPPISPTDAPGLKLVLFAEKLGSLGVASPISYRQIEVGEVEGYRLAEDKQGVEVDIYIEEPYADLVREETKFWNASGIDVSLGAEGVRVDAESLDTLLAGGVAFDTPFGAGAGAPARSGSVFTLYDSYETAQHVYSRHEDYILYFQESVGGLTVGAPVEFRGIKLGEVKEVSLEWNPDELEFRIPVTVQIEPERAVFLNPRREDARDVLDGLIARGFRARLATGNLLTGSLCIEIGLFPDTPVTLVDPGGPVMEVPTIPSTAASLASTMSQFPKLVDAAVSTMEGIDELVNAPEMGAAIVAMEKAAVQASELMEHVDDHAPELVATMTEAADAARVALDEAHRTLAAEGSELQYRLNDALEELAAGMRSIRLLADYLERHPEALIYGKSGGP